MYDINDLLDYVQIDCVIDIFDCLGKSCDAIRKDLTIYEARKWHEEHNYELVSFEPIQRVDLSKKETNYHVFGIQFNVTNIEERT